MAPGSLRRQNLVISWLVRLAGPLLLAYVIFLLVMTFVAQRDFSESYSTQLKLDLEKRSTALSYFYLERIDDIKTLREHGAFETHFANEALGMSMEYGLRASLQAINRAIDQKAQATRLEGSPVFSRIVFLDEQSAILADTAQSAGAVPLPGDGPLLQPGAGPIHVDQGNVVLVMPYEYKGMRKGRLLAYVNHQMVFRKLVYEGNNPEASRIHLLGNGQAMRSDEQPSSKAGEFAEKRWREHSGTELVRSGSAILVYTPVKSTPFSLVAQYHPSGHTSFLTSGWSIIYLMLLALFVLVGLALANRIRSQNLILFGRFEESARHQKALHEQNLALQEEIRKRKEFEAKLSVQAHYDSLTGLPNRTLFMDRLSQALSAAQRAHRFGAVLFVDLDHFKRINDIYGHAVGDRVLKEVASRLRFNVRHEDTVSRLGGDEFVILLPELSHDAETAGAQVIPIAEKIRTTVEAAIHIESQAYTISSSIGITLFPKASESAEDLMREADVAMYRAKESGRNTLSFFEWGMLEAVTHRYALEQELREAIRLRQFELYLQSQVDHGGYATGAEVLIRWNHPDRGMIPPASFVSVAEECGLIVPIGEWVLQEACALIAHLDALGHRLRISVNVSPRQFHQPDFVLRVREILAGTGADPARLILEITENLLVEHTSEVVARMLELSNLGIRFSIDDFGTGYSSLAYLKRLPLFELKIDKSFVQDVPHDPNDVAMVETILSMAHHLHFEVVAEGVETDAQFAFLLQHGCERFQGYFFHRPQTRSEWLAQLPNPTATPVVAHAG
ncbi:MAG: EAL domain-containing protein [Pseudomonadota bacterium]